MKSIYKILILVGAILAVLFGTHLVLYNTSEGYKEFFGGEIKHVTDDMTEEEVENWLFEVYTQIRAFRYSVVVEKADFGSSYDRLEESYRESVKVYNSFVKKNKDYYNDKLSEMGYLEVEELELGDDAEEITYGYLDLILSSLYQNYINEDRSVKSRNTSARFYNARSSYNPEYFKLDRKRPVKELPEKLELLEE